MCEKYFNLINKFKDEFECRKGLNRKNEACSSNEFYELKNFSRKCKICGNVESLITNTAFEGMRKVSILNILEVFKKMQTEYIKYINYASLVSEGRGDIQTLEEKKVRLTNKKIGKLLNIKRESAWRFLKRISDFLPSEYKEGNAPNEWTKGTSQETDGVYNSIFNLLFKLDIYNSNGYIKRKQKEIIGILSNKHYAEENFCKYHF